MTLVDLAVHSHLGASWVGRQFSPAPVRSCQPTRETLTGRYGKLRP